MRSVELVTPGDLNKVSQPSTKENKKLFSATIFSNLRGVFQSKGLKPDFFKWYCNLSKHTFPFFEIALCSIAFFKIVLLEKERERTFIFDFAK